MAVITTDYADELAAKAVALTVQMFCDEDVSLESVAEELDHDGQHGIARHLRAIAAKEG